MATLRYDIIATELEFINLADRLKYQSEISKSPEELALLIEPILIQDRVKPNPETKENFLKRLVKEELDKIFFTPFTTEIDQQVRDTREAEKETMRTNIRNRSTINFVA